MQKSLSLDRPLPLNSIVLHQNFKIFQFSDKQEQLRNSAFKILNKPTEIKYELRTQEGKTFHTQRNYLIPTELLLLLSYKLLSHRSFTLSSK